MSHASIFRQIPLLAPRDFGQSQTKWHSPSVIGWSLMLAMSLCVWWAVLGPAARGLSAPVA